MYVRKPIWFSFFIVLSLSMSTPVSDSFKSEQKKFERVRTAYQHTEAKLKELFKTKNVDWKNFHLLLCGFKYEKKLEVYTGTSASKEYTLLKTYDFCTLSGTVGPKRKEGDGQVPEGLYKIDRFNPTSNFHLSLRINYPNTSDRILADKQHPGSEIYIHGDCVSVGCIPVTDELIEEIYVLCVEARNRHHDIPVYIFPFEMHKINQGINDLLNVNEDTENLWKDLSKAYDQFVIKRRPLNYSIDQKGRYQIH